jgi:hypothetical protein
MRASLLPAPQGSVFIFSLSSCIKIRVFVKDAKRKNKIHTLGCRKQILSSI